MLRGEFRMAALIRSLYTLPQREAELNAARELQR
jgi:hypothetical protein